MGQKKHHRVAKSQQCCTQEKGAFDDMSEQDIAIAIVVVAVIALIKGMFLGYIIGTLVGGRKCN